MKIVLAVVGAAALVTGCARTNQEVPPPALADQMSPLSAPGYMSMAASSDMFEIESSRLALERSRNASVRSFAQMMIDHHTRTSAEMMDVARQAGLTPPPPQLLPPQAAALERLQATQFADFDVAYKREQVAAHEQALMLHQNYASQGDLPPFRALAARTVPIIQSHLTQARNLPEIAPPPPPTRAGERG